MTAHRKLARKVFHLSQDPITKFSATTFLFFFFIPIQWIELNEWLIWMIKNELEYWLFFFLPTSDCWDSGILTWVSACLTSEGLDTHSTLVILSKTAKFGVCLHTEYFQGLFLLHEFILKTQFTMGSALICLKRWKCILQPWLSGGRERAELLIWLPRVTKPRGRRKGRSQSQSPAPPVPWVQLSPSPRLMQNHSCRFLQAAPKKILCKAQNLCIISH